MTKLSDYKPGLGDTHMLVKVEIKIPTGWEKFDQGDAELKQAHNMTEEGRTTSRLNVYRTPKLDEVHKIGNKFRADVRELTLPWAITGGDQLIANSNVTKTKNLKAQAEIDASAAFKIFKDDLAAHKAKDKAGAIGDLYDESKYPTEEELDEKFLINLEFSTVPDAEHDVRAGWDERTMTDYKESVIKGEKVKLANAKAELTKRCHKIVHRVDDRMEKYDGKRKGAFHGSMIKRVKDAIEMCNLLNVDDDKEIKEWAQTMTTEIAIFSTEELREDPDKRAQAGAAAKGLKQRIGARMGGFGSPPDIKPND